MEETSTRQSNNIGNKWTDFKILKELGKGSYGTVYTVKSTINDKVYVMKKLELSNWKEKQQKECWREVSILKKVNHPNIIKYYSSFLESDNWYIIMEYAEGGDLYAWIKHYKRHQKYLDEFDIWRIGYEWLKGWEYLHKNNIIHRDIKLLNLFITKDKHIKIGDWGVSTIVSNINALHYTRVGTPLYLSPELIKQIPYDFKVDIWSFGCSIYHLACLEPPFSGDNLIVLGNNIVKGKPKNIPAQYSDEMTMFIDMALSKRPEKRFNALDGLALIPKDMMEKILKARENNVEIKSRPFSSAGNRVITYNKEEIKLWVNPREDDNNNHNQENEKDFNDIINKKEKQKENNIGLLYDINEENDEQNPKKAKEEFLSKQDAKIEISKKKDTPKDKNNWIQSNSKIIKELFKDDVLKNNPNQPQTQEDQKVSIEWNNTNSKIIKIENMHNNNCPQNIISNNPDTKTNAKISSHNNNNNNNISIENPKSPNTKNLNRFTIFSKTKSITNNSIASLKGFEQNYISKNEAPTVIQSNNSKSILNYNHWGQNNKENQTKQEVNEINSNGKIKSKTQQNFFPDKRESKDNLSPDHKFPGLSPNANNNLFKKNRPSRDSLWSWSNNTNKKINTNNKARPWTAKSFYENERSKAMMDNHNNNHNKCKSSRPLTAVPSHNRFNNIANGNIINININFYNVDMNKRFLAPDINPLKVSQGGKEQELSMSKTIPLSNIDNYRKVNLKKFANNNSTQNNFVFDRIIKTLEQVNNAKRLTINDWE